MYKCGGSEEERRVRLEGGRGAREAGGKVSL